MEPCPFAAIASFATFALPIFLRSRCSRQDYGVGGVYRAGGGARGAAAAGGGGPEGGVALTFLGHASFLIESPQGVRSSPTTTT
jgi:hypothetical protein